MILHLPASTVMSFFRLRIKRSDKTSKLFTILFFVFSTFGLFAQSDDYGEWQLVKAENGINVYSQITTCEIEGSPNPFGYVNFKVENSNNIPLTIGLRFEIYFEEGCNGCNGNEETSTTILLEAGNSIESSCLNPIDKLSYFILNPGFSGSWIYTHSQVQINVIQ